MIKLDKLKRIENLESKLKTKKLKLHSNLFVGQTVYLYECKNKFPENMYYLEESKCRQGEYIKYTLTDNDVLKFNSISDKTNIRIKF